MGEGSISTSWALLLPALDSGSVPALPGAGPHPSLLQNSLSSLPEAPGWVHRASSLRTVLPRCILVTPQCPAVAPVTLLSEGMSASPSSL